MEQLERIVYMERLFDFVSTAMKEYPVIDERQEEIRQAIMILSEYYGSNEWKKDYADDETGLLPKDLKRGVLSEDGIWNLLSDWDELKNGFTKTY